MPGSAKWAVRRAETFAAIADLTDAAQVDRLVSAAEAALGPIDIVVNNAGMVQTGFDEPSQLVQDITEAQWRRGIDINLTSVFLVTRRVVAGMIDRGYGRIVNMSSVTGPVVSNPKGSYLFRRQGRHPRHDPGAGHRGGGARASR